MSCIDTGVFWGLQLLLLSPFTSARDPHPCGLLSLFCPNPHSAHTHLIPVRLSQESSKKMILFCSPVSALLPHDFGELSWPLWASTSPFIKSQVCYGERRQLSMVVWSASADVKPPGFKSQLCLFLSRVTLDKSFDPQPQLLILSLNGG